MGKFAKSWQRCINVLLTVCFRLASKPTLVVANQQDLLVFTTRWTLPKSLSQSVIVRPTKNSRKQQKEKKNRLAKVRGTRKEQGGKKKTKKISSSYQIYLFVVDVL